LRSAADGGVAEVTTDRSRMESGGMPRNLVCRQARQKRPVAQGAHAESLVRRLE